MTGFIVAIAVGVLLSLNHQRGLDRARSRNYRAVLIVLAISFVLGQSALAGALAALYFLPDGMHHLVAIGAGIIVVSAVTWNALAWLWRGTPRARRRCGK